MSVMRRRLLIKAHAAANFFGKPLPLFRCSRVPVQLHLSTLVFPFAFLLCEGWQEDGLSGLGIAAGVLVIVFGSLLIHEFAHVFAARFFGCGTRRVVMLPIGCVAELKSIRPDTSELVIALAGPVASGVLALVAWAVWRAHWMHHSALFRFEIRTLHLPPDIRLLMKAAWQFNATIACFNLLPCFPMDGGRVLRSLLALIVRSRRVADPFLAATRIVVRYVTPPLVIAILLATVLRTHLWSHLLLFPIVMFLGETEYRSIQSARINPDFFGRRRHAEPAGEFV